MKKKINWPVWLEMNEPQEVSSIQEESSLSEFDVTDFNESINFFKANDLNEVNDILGTSLNNEQVLKLINDTIDNGSCSLADVECIAEITPLQFKFIKVVNYDTITINNELMGNRFNQVLTFIKDANSFHLFMKALVIISQVWDEPVSSVVYNNNHKIAWYSDDTLHELIWDDKKIKLVK